MKFYKCPICGNVITVVEGNINFIKCCDREMEELVPNKVDASIEKHVPICVKEGNTVKVSVGKMEHPMDKEHYITFIASVTENSATLLKLTPESSPVAVFNYVEGMKIYSYCNLHGLWINENIV